MIPMSYTGPYVSICCIVSRDWCIPLVIKNILKMKWFCPYCITEVNILTRFNNRRFPRDWNIYSDNDNFTIGRKRNLLKDLSNGIYILYMDDDNYEYDTRLYNQLTFMKNNPTINITSPRRNILYFKNEDISCELNGLCEGSIFMRNSKEYEFKDSNHKEGEHFTELLDFRYSDNLVNILIHHNENITKRIAYGKHNESMTNLMKMFFG